MPPRGSAGAAIAGSKFLVLVDCGFRLALKTCVVLFVSDLSVVTSNLLVVYPRVQVFWTFVLES